MGVKQMLLNLTLASRRALTPRSRANRVAPALGSKWEQKLGVGQSWTPLSYGEYYPRSALVYSAIRVRQDAVVRVPLRVYRRIAGPDRESASGLARVERRAGVSVPQSGLNSGPSPSLEAARPDWSDPNAYTSPSVRDNTRQGMLQPVGPDHVAQRLLDTPNPFWTRGDLWRSTETYLGLWGSAYWGLERDAQGQVSEIWPLRPDKTRVIPDTERYIKGFVYVGQGQRLIPYVPEDIVWIHYFNPLDEYAGLSPIAPLRLSADMGLDALRASRNNLSNESTPGLFVETTDTPTDDEVKEFYERWEARFKGVDKVRRPVLLSGGMKAANLGFSPKDMEYVQSLRWSLEDVARVYGIPKAMLGDIERITFSNFQTARKVLWEDTIVPQLIFYQEALQQMLLPNFSDPALTVEFDLTVVEALRENENDKAQRRQVYVNTGILTINEVRQEMNLPPVEWGDWPSADADRV